MTLTAIDRKIRPGYYYSGTLDTYVYIPGEVCDYCDRESTGRTNSPDIYHCAAHRTKAEHDANEGSQA